MVTMKYTAVLKASTMAFAYNAQYEGSCSKPRGRPRRFDGVGQKPLEIERVLRPRLGDHRPETPRAVRGDSDR